MLCKHGFSLQCECSKNTDCYDILYFCLSYDYDGLPLLPSIKLGCYLKRQKLVTIFVPVETGNKQTAVVSA